MSESDPRLARGQRIAFVIGVAGVAAAALGFVLPGCLPHFFRAWLVGFNLFTGAAVGSLVVLMLQYLTGGLWGHALRPTLEAAAKTLPLMAVLFVPLALGMDYVYEWSRFEKVYKDESLHEQELYKDVDPHDHELKHKMPLLNNFWFFVRAGGYFSVWMLLTYLLSRWSEELDRKRDPSILDRCATLSAPGLVLYVITVTFAAIDWGMSLEPKWYSTIYMAMFGMGQVLTGFAICVTTFTLLSDRHEVSVQTRSDQGTLLGAFLMIWAYLSLMQFLIIWMGHLNEELPWYVVRIKAAPWNVLAITLLIFHFAVPFGLLMSPEVKRTRNSLIAVCVLICAMRVIDMVWLIVPAFTHEHSYRPDFPPLAGVVYAGAIAGVGGLWFAAFLGLLGRRPLLPSYSPEEAVHGEAAHA